jgi:ferredoxin
MKSARLIRVVPGKCQGHARCAAMAPDIFELDDDGYIMPGDIVVAEKDAERAWRGAKSCPERALEIVE